MMSPLKAFLETPAGQARTRAEWIRALEVSDSHFYKMMAGQRLPSLELAFKIEDLTCGAIAVAMWKELALGRGQV